MLWTSALLAAALTQAPSAVDSTSSADAAPAATSSSWIPQWTTVQTENAPRFGFANFVPRVGVQHRSQGYGYDSGYTSFDAFVPIYQQDFSRLSAFQGSFLIDNYGDLGFVAGLVHRQHIDSLERVVGVNSFYNHRQQGGNDFHQVGFGLETLGNYLDWRGNAYFPLGDDFQVPNSGGGVTDAIFSGRSILVNFIADKPLTGFDTEIGGIIPGSLDIFRAYAGMYHFSGDYSDNATGVQGRLEARLRDSGAASVSVTNDGVFGTNVVFAIGFWLPGTSPRNTPPHGRAAARLAEDVVRNQNIVIDRSPTKDPVAARWLSGSVIDVVHINSGAALPGFGTPNLPVTTLADAELLGHEESLLFVHANSQFAGQSITLKDDQQLLGEGVPHTIQSLYGTFTLPTVTPANEIVAVPTITGSAGDTITLANNNVVSGFQIINSGGYGVIGDGITNVTLDRLNINSALFDGIQLTNVAGNINVTNNFLNGNGERGVEISTSIADRNNAIVISDNTILGNPEEGISVTTNGASKNTLVMEKNLVRVSLGPTDTRADSLVEIVSRNSSQVSARVENNDIEDSFARDQTSPDEDPYYQQVTLIAADNSRVDIGFINNRLVSDRNFLAGNPRNGSFGLDLNSTDLAVLRARLDSNTSSLNYAFAENYISTFQLEDTLSTNTGTMYYFPTQNFIETIPSGTLNLP